jgi:mTERF domain-containing protein
VVWHVQVEYLRQLGIVDAIIGKMIATRPQLLACDIEDWRTLVKYFQFLGVQKSSIQRILSVHPSVFCMNLEKNIAPKVKLVLQALIFMVFFLSK